MSDESSALIQLGLVGAPYGVRGWIKLRSHTDPPERLLEHRNLRIGRGEVWRDYRVEASGRSRGALTVKLSGVDDRDRAKELTGAQVCVPRSELPKRSSTDFYQADLIGCEAVTPEGVSLGSIRHFVQTPAHTLMVVRGANEHWIPAVPKHLKRVDLEARQVVVDWHAAE